jgi:hypothetical protein
MFKTQWKNFGKVTEKLRKSCLKEYTLSTFLKRAYKNSVQNHDFCAFFPHFNSQGFLPFSPLIFSAFSTFSTVPTITTIFNIKGGKK